MVLISSRAASAGDLAMAGAAPPANAEAAVVATMSTLSIPRWIFVIWIPLSPERRRRYPSSVPRPSGQHTSPPKQRYSEYDGRDQFPRTCATHALTAA